jgi:hypothetical protein
VDYVVARALQLAAIIDPGLNGSAAPVTIVEIAMAPGAPMSTVVVIATAPGIDAHTSIASDHVVAGTGEFAAIVACDRDGVAVLRQRGAG